MSPFPQAIARAQREAVTNDLREVRASLNATLAALNGVEPHLLALKPNGLSGLKNKLHDAEAAVFEAIMVLNNEELQA